jgi:maltose O-acetyltransferase
MSEKQKMLHGELYFANDPELAAEREQTQAQPLHLNVNSIPEQRLILLQSLLGSMGESVAIRSPFFCDYGYNITNLCTGPSRVILPDPAIPQ